MQRANLTLNFLLFETLNLSSAQELELPVPSSRVTSGYETLGLWLPRGRAAERRAGARTPALPRAARGPWETDLACPHPRLPHS